MGDKLLKKLLLILLFSAFALANSGVTTEWIDKMVEEIKPPRVGVSKGEISHLKNPFMLIKKATKKSKKGRASTYKWVSKTGTKHHNFRLMATLNKSAKINNRWYAINSKIGGYKLTKITQDYVVLVKPKRKPLKVYLRQKNRKIKLKTK